MTIAGKPIHNLARKGLGSVAHSAKTRTQSDVIITECGRCGVRPGWPAWERACSIGRANLEKDREIKSIDHLKYLTTKTKGQQK